MRKIVMLLLALLMVSVQVAAAQDVQSLVEELPAVEVLREMDMEAQRRVYDRTQAAYDDYMALSEGEKAEIEGAEETFEGLFGYFNTLVAPAEETAAVSGAEPAEESGTGSEILSTVIAVAAGIFLARKIVTKRKL